MKIKVIIPKDKNKKEDKKASTLRRLVIPHCSPIKK
jgi:hypothetical protein